MCIILFYLLALPETQSEIVSDATQTGRKIVNGSPIAQSDSDKVHSAANALYLLTDYLTTTRRTQFPELFVRS
ncbi:unnamed protein product [Cochlearia groenlandica]